ncbi:MAG: site-specific DNA-methyltransferase [Akkermansia sp.]|nr:site-specific DNA-methyltransferase [Akkermansia sp.]
MPYEESSPTSPEAQSASPIQENLRTLASLFPSVVRDGQVDVDALRQLCGEAVVKEDELFGLNWRGKAEARRAALTPSLGTLRPCKEESKDWDTTRNLYIEGDNLEVLKLLRKSYGGRVKMIYIDPPYNTGKEFVYPDDYQNGIENYKKLTGQESKFAANVESSGRFHTTWLNMMYPRLVLARDMLSDDGVIFISIDDHEDSNLMQLCNEIFGQNNFIAQMIWERAYSPKNDAKYISNSHDYVLMYVKNSENFQIGRLERTEEANARYSNPDNDPRGVWKASDISVKTYNAACDYPITTPSGRVVEPPAGRCWSLSQNAFCERLQDGRIWFGPNGDSVPSMKRFLSELKYEGMAPTSILFYKEVGHSQEGAKEVVALFGDKGVFDGPKPIRLLQRLMTLANLEQDSIVMDFFSGSSSTAHALMQYNATKNASCKFIMTQMPIICEESSPAHQAGYKNICEIGKERIRRAGEKVKEEAGLAGQNLDIGFRVYKLDSSNVKAWNPQTEDLATAVNNYAEHLVGGRTEEDFLTEIMLKSGIDLVEEVEVREIAGHRVLSLGFGQYYACMAADLAEDAEDVALGIAAWHEEDCAFAGGEQQDTCTVFVSDRAFASNDAAKMNFVAILEQHGICNIKAL